MTNREFIRKLKKAKAAVVSGKNSCGMADYACHHCALANSGIGALDYKLEGYRGKKDEWSFNKSKKQVIALFDNSIKALVAVGIVWGSMKETQATFQFPPSIFVRSGTVEILPWNTLPWWLMQ